MTLRLREFADHAPDVGWPRNGTRYVVLSRNEVVGSILQVTGGPGGGHWTWSITILGGQDHPRHGAERTREAAQAALATAWRAWLASAGLAEIDK
jgi:hypothetical protein